MFIRDGEKRMQYTFKDYQKRYFWSKVNVIGLDDCWEWKASCNKGGYAQVSLNGYSVHAHRISYTLTHGAIPEGLLIRHKCDNRKCVNPCHLSVGTAKDNIQDAISRGRQVRGETSGKSKLTEKQVVEIYSDKREYFFIARDFNISTSTVKRIKNKWAWKHVVDEL